MENNSKLIAIIMAVIAAMLVILAGKSCTEDINRTNQRNSNSSKQSTTYREPTPQEVFGDNEYYYYGDTPPGPLETTEEVTTEYIEYVTDLIGRVVGTVPPEETTPYEEREAQIPTVTKSILEEYNERQLQTEPEYSTTPVVTENPYQNATFPSDFVIVVN